MGCDIYYLDQFRAAVTDAKATVVVDIKAAEELMQEAKASMKMMSECAAKLMLDLAFSKITNMSNEAAMERLVRYAGELLRKADHDLNERQDHETALKEFFEDQLEDD